MNHNQNIMPKKKNKYSCILSSRDGFSLIEMIIVMAIFMGIIIISSEAFNKIVSVSSQQTTSSESDVQGVVGLEILRSDLEHAGYGLPWILGFVGDFAEAVSVSLAPGTNAQDFNDANSDTTATGDTNKVPRAIQAGTSTVDGRDYLVIKSILAGMNDTVKKWSYVEGVGTDSLIKTWGSNDFATNDTERVVTLDSRTKRLIASDTSNFFYTVSSPKAPPAGFQPINESDVYIVYGVSGTANLKVPYNRVDYYVKRPTTASDMPTRCAPGTGILYKGIMSHSDGDFVEHPLVECVADLQVVFDLDTNGDGEPDTPLDDLSPYSAKQIREELKAIKIYLVTHEGGRDRNFTYSSQQLVVGEGNGRSLDLAALVGSNDYKHYRWKTYKLTVIPKNINY